MERGTTTTGMQIPCSKRYARQIPPLCLSRTNSGAVLWNKPMTDPRYAACKALDPFFELAQQAVAGLVDGNHYFDTIADDAVFDFRYDFPGWPRIVRGRNTLIDLYAGYGNNIVLHSADALVVHRSQDPRVVILEY